MAKTTKTVKRTATSSSSKGSVSKKKGFLGRSFNLKSRKVQFIVSILIIALLGGGYFTFKSFAAKPAQTFSRATGNLHAGSGYGDCGISPYNDPVLNQKNPTPVWSIACSGKNYSDSAAVYSSEIDSFLDTRQRACAYIRGKAAAVTIQLQTRYNVSVGKSTRYTNINSSGYTYLCSPPATSPGSFNGTPSNGIVRVEGGAGWINVSSIVIEPVSTATTTPTNPLPTK